MTNDATAPRAAACAACRDGTPLGFDFTMAFQPIVDMTTMRPWAYEALIRGTDGAGAASVLSHVSAENRYAFDQRCRVVAIEKAVAAGLLDDGAKLSINFLPDAVYSPKACIQLTLRTAAATGFPTDRLMFEFTENEKMADPAHVMNIIATYQQMGFTTALDDFGSGHSGLNLLAQFRPDVIKLDMELIRGLDASMPRRMIVDAVVRMCAQMGITIIAEGVETPGELDAIRRLGITLVQGYLLAKPAFEALPLLTIAPPAPLLRAAG